MRGTDTYSASLGYGWTTPVGEFDTVKVARQGDERETAELWLAAERAFIPVRLLVVEKDGTRYEQVATRISQ